MNDSISVTLVLQMPVPDSATFSNSSGYAFRLLEESGNTTIGRVTLESIPDYLEDYVMYSTENCCFFVDSTTGDISVQRNFDYESDENQFGFEVAATLIVPHVPDRVDLAASVNVTVEILDVNDNTPFFDDFPESIYQYEGRQESEVAYTFSANDSDSGYNAELRFVIIENSNFSAQFLTLDPITGQLIATAGLDREDSLQHGNHTVRVQVCDRGFTPRCVDNTTMFKLLDINDNSPRLSSGSTYHVYERWPLHTWVFSFSAEDPDSGMNGTVRYYLNSSDSPFYCDENTGEVMLNGEIDYEVQESYNITLTLTDTGDPALATSYSNITIGVVDLPDSVPQFNITSLHTTISPNVSAGYVLLQLLATDDDSNDTLKFAITSITVNESNNHSSIVIREDTGEIVSDEGQIFHPETILLIDVLVYDQSAFNLSSTASLVITVTPNQLVFTESEYSVNISEAAALGSLIATINLDPLSVSTDVRLDFRIVEPALAPNIAPFTSNFSGTSTIEFYLASEGVGLNREVVDTYTILITAIRLNETAQTTLLVDVADVNDNSPRLLNTEQSITVSSNTVANAPVARVNASDLDTGENSKLEFYLLSSGINQPFRISKSTGVVHAQVNLSGDEIHPSYDIIVYVRDLGHPKLEDYFTYTINIVDEVVEMSTQMPEVSATVPTLEIIIIGFGSTILLLLLIITVLIAMLCREKRDSRHSFHHSQRNNDKTPLRSTKEETELDDMDFDMFETKAASEDSRNQRPNPFDNGKPVVFKLRATVDGNARQPYYNQEHKVAPGPEGERQTGIVVERLDYFSRQMRGTELPKGLAMKEK